MATISANRVLMLRAMGIDPALINFYQQGAVQSEEKSRKNNRLVLRTHTHGYKITIKL